MAEVWVVNASPIILLGKVGLLHLPEQLADEVVVPAAVAHEILAGPVDDPARQRLASDYGVRGNPTAIPGGILEWGLGPGETAVIALALERKDAVAVLDDKLGRAAARSHQLPILGTIGIIVRARRAGLLESAARALDDLQRAGLYLDARLVAAALRLAGE